VHTADCQFALESDPERRVDVAWSKIKTAVLPVKIRVLCHDEKGILANITVAITNCEANIASAQIQSTIDQRGENIFEVNVIDLSHLQKVMNALMKIKGVIKVERIKR
jgi:GTP pyrophosphokinase